MKINDTATAVAGKGDAFTIAATGKAFRILSDGLYSDKIRAVIRELSCNARDSHVAAKNSATWDMHLPTDREPWFSITDYGTGMSDADVHSIYTRYFASTKTSSNDYVGQLGLGSKSPFSYTNEFFVTSRHKGIATQYRMYFDATDTPRIETIGSGFSSDSGVTVKFDVKYGDIARWSTKAIEVLQWFDQKPKQTGAAINFVLMTPPAYTGNGWRIWNKRFWNGESLQALMGGVLYPINVYSIDLNAIQQEQIDLIYSMGDLPLVVEFDIGELEVAASRESIGYDNRTSINIVNRLTNIVDNLKTTLWNVVESKPTRWEARMAYGTVFNNKDLGQVFTKMFSEYAKPVHSGETIKSQSFVLNMTELAMSGRISNESADVRVFSVDKKTGNYVPKPHINCADNTVIMFDDVVRGSHTRIKEYHVAKLLKNNIIVFKKTDDMNTILNLLGHPKYMMTSELAAPEKKTRVKSPEVWLMNEKFDSGKKAWTPAGEVIASETNICYYLPMYGWDVHITDNGHSSVHSVSALLDRGKRLKLIPQNTKIYGIRAKNIENVKANLHWVHFGDHMKAHAVRLSTDRDYLDSIAKNVELAAIDVVIAKTIGTSVANHLTNSLYSITSRLKYNDSDFVKFFASLKHLRGSRPTDTATITDLCRTFKIKVEEPNFDSDRVTLAEFIGKKYTLLKHIDYSTSYYNKNISDEKVAALVDYIDAVDTAYTFNMLTAGMDEQVPQ